MGIGIIYARVYYGKHYIWKVDLIGKGDKLRLSYYTMFGTKSRIVSLNDIESYKQTPDWYLLKLKDSKMNYLVDRNGVFPNNKLLVLVLNGRNPYTVSFHQ
eukprot:TRINITY_DN4279_c0_g2_i1.p1 TRINITY_DN4279_c0_g2~~TRINITY_DN4279_c0_g2_i1.p1  ORF type:complete len:101 (+),score=9.35 TRINITY_DN4279_c0_g2_i1:183-485(+)